MTIGIAPRPQLAAGCARTCAPRSVAPIGCDLSIRCHRGLFRRQVAAHRRTLPGLVRSRLVLRLLPQSPGDRQRIDVEVHRAPPIDFLAGLMQLIMVDAAKGHRELVAHLEADPTRLGEAQVMRIRRCPAADQATTQAGLGARTRAFTASGQRPRKPCTGVTPMLCSAPCAQMVVFPVSCRPLPQPTRWKLLRISQRAIVIPQRHGTSEAGAAGGGSSDSQRQAFFYRRAATAATPSAPHLDFPDPIWVFPARDVKIPCSSRVGNLRQNTRIFGAKMNTSLREKAEITKFPVLFPVSRESGTNRPEPLSPSCAIYDLTAPRKPPGVHRGR